LTSKLASPALLTYAQTEPLACPATVSSREAHTASEAGPAGALAADETAEAPEAGLIDEVEPFWAPSLSNEALRLLLAIVSGHEQVGGLLLDNCQLLLAFSASKNFSIAGFVALPGWPALH